MTRIFTALLVLAAAQAAAQHHAHPPGGHPHAAMSPYTGEEAREIKALSAQEQRGWLEGQGMGLARAAELNSYPGPMHVLEHADALNLDPSQRQQARALLERHKAEVRALGAELVAAERRLDELFRARQATPAQVSELALQVGTLQGRIRAAHLNTHLAQTATLRPGQVADYDRLRGYVR